MTTPKGNHLPLSCVTDPSQLHHIIQRLWEVLDAIDTDSKRFKPDDPLNYRRFYEQTIRRLEERHRILHMPYGGLLCVPMTPCAPGREPTP